MNKGVYLKSGVFLILVVAIFIVVKFPHLFSNGNSNQADSDESSGNIGYYDLPVSGMGLDSIKSGRKYILEDKFTKSTTMASNGSPFVLELTNPPQ
jgi:hypothetical protein